MKKVLFGIVALSLLLFISSCQKEDEMAKQDITVVADDIIPGQYVVVLKPSTNKAFAQLKYVEKVQLVKQEALQMGVDESSIQQAYGSALRGFAAKLSVKQLSQLKQ